jgi:hypothetical protein|tara:strand:- start:307 stop:474 length:168 start_codon:yes stop_codon:yes gene_type:complete
MFAGLTYCGIDIPERLKDDVYMHLPIMGVVQTTKFVMEKIDCKECKQFFFDAMDE